MPVLKTWLTRHSERLALCCGTACAAALMLAPLLAIAQSEDTQRPNVPMPFFWHLAEDTPAPDMSDIKGINFLTDSDYPPFNYRDADQNLVGFNVDLAKALCGALRVRCRIAAGKWENLIPALEKKQADAVIASMAISTANRRRVEFTFPYYRSPARFAVQKPSDISQVTPQSLDGRLVGVRAGTAHEAFLKAFFPSADIRSYNTTPLAREALSTGKVEALFGDGTSLMFWLNGTASNQCCRFLPGAYTESRYFGNGAGIAVRREDTVLRDALNYALDRIKVSGTYDRLYRKHFPLDLY